MLHFHLRAAFRTMSSVPAYRLAFSSSVAVPINRYSAHCVSFLRPLRLVTSRHLSTSPITFSAVVNGPSVSAASGNGVAVASGFEDAPVFDDITATLSSESLDPSTLADHIVPPVNDSGVIDPKTPPISSFRLSPVTVERLSKNEITHATEVQAGTFDTIYDGNDLIAKSRTGTGKTLAFALPIMERLAIVREQHGGRRAHGAGPSCIVLAPTRELAKQVAREMTSIGEGLRLSVECFYGGSAYPPQEKALSRGLDVLVGTPGRIIDHLERGTLRLDDIQFAVLDEADEMLSMGFSQDVEHIFETLPPKEERQVILFSATVPSWVKGLASQFQRDSVVTFDAVTSGSKTATTVRHCAVRVPEREESRAGLLADIIAVHSHTKKDEEDGEDAIEQGVAVLNGDGRAEIGPSRAIVFTQTKREADELATSGALDGCGAAVLHGDVTQRQREVTLSQFRKGNFQVLVATDVAARGLDITGVDVVIQYRVPRDSESYIHRAGRTGRAGKSGTAVVMYSDREAGLLRTLERECRIKFEQESAPAPELALEAAVDLTLSNLWTVEERVRKHLLGRAESIGALGEEERVETIAALLAVAGRRTRLEDRSVLSGEGGMRTLVVRDDSGREVNSGRALRFVNTIGRNLFTERLQVGLIRVCRDGSAVVDVSSDQAVALLDEWKGRGDEETGMDEARDMGLILDLAVEVPALKDQRRQQGGGGDYIRRRGSHGGYGGGGGRRDSNRRRGNGGGWRGGDRMSSRRGEGGYGGDYGRDDYRRDNYGRGEYGRGDYGGRGGRRGGDRDFQRGDRRKYGNDMGENFRSQRVN